jgi:hypothetical protein
VTAVTLDLTDITHETLWGTVGGAWESGERAADVALKRVGGARRR